MKFRTQKITALMASAIVGVSTLGSVSVMAAESTEAMADQAGMVVDRDAIAADGDAIPSDFIQGTFKPSETTVQAQDSYEYPFIGLNMKLPEELLKQIKAQTIAMITNEIWNDNADAIPKSVSLTLTSSRLLRPRFRTFIISGSVFSVKS